MAIVIRHVIDKNNKNDVDHQVTLVGVWIVSSIEFLVLELLNVDEHIRRGRVKGFRISKREK